jgi:hypothetical protein
VVAAELVIEAARAGRAVDCAVSGEPGVVDAELLRSLCRERRDEVDDRGLRLHNAVISGALDLSAVTVGFPLRLVGCRFEHPVDISGATLAEMLLIRCRLPGLLGNGVDVRRDLNLSGCTISGSSPTTASESRTAAIWLCESHVGGRLLCVDTSIHPGEGRAIQADRMQVGGTVRFIHSFTATGEVRLLGARIDGSLDLTGAHLADGNGLAIDLADAAIGGGLYLIGRLDGRKLEIEGRVALYSAQVAGQLVVRDATITASTARPSGNYMNQHVYGSALGASRLSVGGGMAFEGDCRIRGRTDLPLATLSSLTAEPQCRFDAPGSTALDLTNAEVSAGLRLAAGVAVRGTLRLTGATIHGRLTLTGITLSDPEDRSCLAAQSAHVDGDVELHSISVTGGKVNFRAATVGGAFDARGATLHNPRAFTLSLHHTHVRGSVRLVDGFRSTGAVMLNRTTIDGRLDCTDATLTCAGPTPENPTGTAMEAFSAVISGGMYLGWHAIEPDINLTEATTSTLADDLATWPDRYTLTGFTYERFEAVGAQQPDRAWNGPARRQWLRAQHEFDAGSYEQAARVFRQHGYLREAEDILIAQRRDATRAVVGRSNTRWTSAVLHRLRSALFGLTVGYGYRPGRVLWMLAVLLVAVTVTVQVPTAQATFRATDPAGNVYGTSGRLITITAPDAAAPADTGFAVPAGREPTADACGDGQVRCFSPVFYAVDTVVPLVSLGQRAAWYPNRAAPWGNLVDTWLNLATILGWILSSIFLLSFTRLARNV